MTELPAHLRAAARELRKENDKQQLQFATTAPIQRGDLRVINPPLRVDAAVPNGGRRIGLVLSVDSNLEFAEVLLGHPEEGLATDFDIVVPRPISRAPFVLVMQTALRGVVWTLQLGRLVGRLEPHAMTDFQRLFSDAGSGRYDLGTSANFKTGTPFDDLSEELWDFDLWEFKAQEGASLHRLAADCTNALLDDDTPVRVDHRLLQPELLDLADDKGALLERLMLWLETRPVEIESGDLPLLISSGSLERETWRSFGAGDRCLDSILDFVLKRATCSTTYRPPDPSTPYDLLTAAHLAAVEDTRPFRKIHLVEST